MNRILGLIVICASISALPGCLSVPPEDGAAAGEVQEPYPDPILSGRPTVPPPAPNLPRPDAAPEPPPKADLQTTDLQTAAGQPGVEADPDGQEAPGSIEDPDAPQQQAALPPPDAVEPLDPKTLIGAEREDIRLRFGAPDREEERVPGFVWHYTRAECGLSLFFYLDVKSNTYRMLTYELLAQDPPDGGISQGGTDDAERIGQCYRRFGSASG